ncbi:hypothetical protein CBS147323_6561 [Aspergillus niger]|nr:hypothetical protein CBS147323_6561 [Aspergillus niger]
MNDGAAGEVSVISLGTFSISTPPTDISINVGADPNSTVSDVKTPQSSGADHSPNSDLEKENGRSHATLLDFGLGECPKCSQNLMAVWTQPAWPQQEFNNPQEYSSQQFNNEPGPPLPMNGEAEQSVPAPEVHEDPKTEPSSIVTYCLEYRDSGNNIITTVPWAGPFDSSVIRKNAEVKQLVIFNVTTVLETSVPSDPHRYAHETEGLLQDGIITNPTIDVGYQGRIYVDPASYFAQHEYTAPDICEVEDMGDGLAKCLCEECRGWKPHPLPDFRWAAYDLLDPRVDKDLELPQSPEGAHHRYLLCSRVLYGLVLKSRTWEELNVAYCQEPKVNRRAIDSLVMPEARKEMIRALVQKYTDPTPDKRSKSWGADFIENKGEGQIFLLHGSPGVGKTFTAAEYTGRALLSLTVGDIGTDEVVMEKQLSKWFTLAEQWGAVMLIDEADVYLERRQITDLKRNSLVSVFLRCIEYYRGILFLTTNRVGHFDDAFISRIHVVIRYDNLSEENRRTIWEQFFDKLADERHDFVVTRRAKSYVLEDEVISKMQWNGREIRNAFQTAVALAEYRFSQKPDKSKDDGPTLDQRDFEQVCNMTRDFKQYLTTVHGVDEEDRAFHAKARVGNLRRP